MAQKETQEPLICPFTILIDQQEKLPYSFAGLKSDAKQGRRPLVVPTKVVHLKTGDYAIEGLERQCAVERKGGKTGLEDLFGTLGQGRDRFERELERLAEMDFALVVCEGTWQDVLDIYHPALIEMRAICDIMSFKGDETYPWDRWLAAFNEIMPGPPAYSELNPKTIFRSVLAWRVRFPRVHWEFCQGRRFAEVMTFRTLERCWKEFAKR